MTRYQPDQPRAHQRRFPSVCRLAADDRLPPLDDLDCLKLDLCRALHLWPADICLDHPGGITNVLRQLRHALRRQRGHAISGHWSYDLACHARLFDLYKRTRAITERCAL